MLSENLKRIRTEQRYTKTELGKRANMSPRTIELIENGGNANPTIKTIEALAKVLKVSIYTLIKWKPYVLNTKYKNV